MRKTEIRKMVMAGATGEYSHFIVYCDHWDYTHGTRYIKHDEDIHEVIKRIKAGGSPGMYSIEEVYNYSLDLDSQLNEFRAYHIEPLAKKEEVPYITDNLKKAISYALKMHEGQLRHDGAPYIRHPLNVVKNVLKYKKSKNLEALLISACLHDTLEDSKASYYDIVDLFGAQVASIVLELTTDEDMKNIMGKDCYLAIKMKNMSSWALVIKLCDRLDNISDLEASSEDFRQHYIDETISIMDYLLRNRDLSRTHIVIIEHIMGVLLQLCEGDEKRTSSLAEMYKILAVVKNNFDNDNDAYDKLLEVAKQLEKNNTGIARREIILQ